MANTGYIQATIAYKVSRPGGLPLDIDGNLTSQSGRKQAIALMKNFLNPDPNRYEVETYFEKGQPISGNPTIVYDAEACPPPNVIDSVVSEIEVVFSFSNQTNLLNAVTIDTTANTKAIIDWGDGAPVIHELNTIGKNHLSKTFTSGNHTVNIKLMKGTSGVSFVNQSHKCITRINKVQSDIAFSCNSMFSGQANLTDISNFKFETPLCNNYDKVFHATSIGSTLREDLFGCARELRSKSGNPNAVIRLQDGFMGSSVNNLPQKLFWDVPVSNFFETFKFCWALTSFPTLFLKGQVDAIWFEGFANNCNALESIPDGFFDDCVKAHRFSFCFYKNWALTSCPSGLFDKTLAGSQIVNDNNAKAEMDGVFGNCYNITIDINQIFQLNKYPNISSIGYRGEYYYNGLFDGNHATTSPIISPMKFTGDAEAFYNKFSTNTILKWVGDGNHCFRGCGNLTNLDSIPATWK